jgi:hypothetical protein
MSGQSVGFMLDSFKPKQGQPSATRNARTFVESSRHTTHQEKLRDYISALVKAYGYREDYTAPNYRSVPYIPAPFAEHMLMWFRQAASDFLDKDIPTAGKQPGFIKLNRDAATRVLGEIVGGKLKINAANFEQAPPEVASKAPDYFKADLPEGKPHPLVLTGPNTWEFIDRLHRLAIHFDALMGSPTNVDIFVESVVESIKELPQTLAGAANAVANPIKEGSKWIMIAAVVVAGVVVYTLVRR